MEKFYKEQMTLYTHSIAIQHIYISPGHNYFGHEVSAPGKHPTANVAQVEVKADMGLVGDRFYGRGPNFDGHVTFFAGEVYQLAVETLALSALAPIALRRNVITLGVPLNQLIGHEFWIDGVHFRGAKHCVPCRWMDASLAQGAQKFLRGRGGLRAQALSDGALRRGPAQLTTTVELDLSAITEPLPLPRLP